MYKHNRQFNVNVIMMFDYLAKASKLLWNREHALHIFLNYNPTYRELHYRHMSRNSVNDILTESLFYERQELRDFNDTKELAKLLRGHHERSVDHHRSMSRVRILVNEEKDKLINSEYICRMITSKEILQKSDPIILILDDDDANLGCLLLYGNFREVQNSTPFSDDASSNSAVSNWAKTISWFLRQQAEITSETYLPSYRRRQSTQAAILFGDITNFTQLSIMLRIIEASHGQGKIEQLGDIMQKHCGEMSRIVSTHRGRIERFIGDGLMAVFGEHKEHPVLAVGHAVAAATRMVENFRARRREIQDIIFGAEGQHEVNEMIEIDYAIGINYGTVLFDYLGDDLHREYSCIGDHVAFADRLMHKAARFDLDTGDTWPPILVSQTAEQHLKYWLSKDSWEKRGKEAKRILHVRGYGYPSYVFGIGTDLFDFKKYKMFTDRILKKEKSEFEIVEDLKNMY